MIVAAALKIDDLILTSPSPARHHTLFYLAHKYIVAVPSAEQGFITDQGRFVDRRKAKKIAIAEGQIIDQSRKQDDSLYSEDLW